MTKIEIEQTLRDYHWMVREIERLRVTLYGAGERVVRQYEAIDMPKPQGGVSDPVYSEVARREKLWSKLTKYETKIAFILRHIDSITNERERTVLDCTLDGMNFVDIADHMGLSQTHIKRIKNDLIDHLYELQLVTA